MGSGKMIKLKDLLKKEKLKEGRFKLSPRSEMHWGMDKVVVLSGNKKVVLTRKELAALLKGAKMHRLTKEEIDEAGSLGGPIDASDIESNYIAPGRDTGVKNQGVYLQKFSSNEAKKIVDGQLKNMVQDIRKVEGRVIKTWMTAAKAGKIDFFDIIRGLKTGDVRRAHTFEMDFFVKLLTRNKIVDRFRSYFKGKKGKKR